MSNPIAGIIYLDSNPSSFIWKSFEVYEYPITPPAGPDKIAFEPEKLSIGARPPSLYIKNTLELDNRSSSNPSLNSCRYL